MFGSNPNLDWALHFVCDCPFDRIAVEPDACGCRAPLVIPGACVCRLTRLQSVGGSEHYFLPVGELVTALLLRGRLLARVAADHPVGRHPGAAPV